MSAPSKCQSLISKEPAMKRKFGDIMEWYEDDLEGWWEAMGEQAPGPWVADATWVAWRVLCSCGSGMLSQRCCEQNHHEK